MKTLMCPLVGEHELSNTISLNHGYLEASLVSRSARLSPCLISSLNARRPRGQDAILPLISPSTGAAQHQIGQFLPIPWTPEIGNTLNTI